MKAEDMMVQVMGKTAEMSHFSTADAEAGLSTLDLKAYTQVASSMC